MSDYLDPNNEELLKDFFAEAQGQVDTLEQNILVLENDPHNKDAVDEIFRAAHTLKGGAATVQMFELSEFTHVVEDVLDEIRTGAVKVSEAVVDTLLKSIDVIKLMLEARLEGEIYEEDIGGLKNRLTSFLATSAEPKTKPKASAAQAKAAPVSNPPSPSVTSPTKAASSLSEYEVLELKQAADGRPIYRVVVEFDEANPMNSVGGIQVFAVLKEQGSVLKTIPEFDKLYEDQFWPTVEYFVALDKDPQVVQKKCQIPDVTTKVTVQDLEKEILPAPAKAKAPEPPQAKTAESPKVPTSVPGPSVSQEESSESVKEDLPPPEEHEAAKEGKKASSAVVGSILRVDSKRIDNLLNLVSETVISKATFSQISNQFGEALTHLQEASLAFRTDLKDLLETLPQYLDQLQKGKTVKELKKDLQERYGKTFTLFDPVESQLKGTVATFRGTAQNLGRIIGELHEGVLRIRMVPISQIFSRFPRLVRDLSKTLNKKISLVIDGEETELDKSVIEDLLDPLIHCVRNAIDHGIESTSVRQERGKPEEGRVVLAARNEGNMIVIEISDDGNGIDVEAVKRKGVERGLVHPGKILSDVEAFNLIFEPGFSTAEKVTNISGRGVGLDVVRKQIEKLNGTVSIWSEKGLGSKFTIKLPLTLAIIQGLLVRVGREVYAIPITSVIDSHRIKASEIKVIDNYEVFNVRKDVVSLMRLNRLFGIEADENVPFHYVVVVGSGDKKIGLVVDALIGEEDVVIKPLKDQYTNTPGIAGATILGDGKVSLIIDVSQLLDLGLRNERTARQKRETWTK